MRISSSHSTSPLFAGMRESPERTIDCSRATASTPPAPPTACRLRFRISRVFESLKSSESWAAIAPAAAIARSPAVRIARRIAGIIRPKNSINSTGDEFRRRNESVQMPTDDFLDHDVGTLFGDEIGVEVVLPDVHRAAEMLGQERHEPRDERIAENHGAWQ